VLGNPYLTNYRLAHLTQRSLGNLTNIGVPESRVGNVRECPYKWRKLETGAPAVREVNSIMQFCFATKIRGMGKTSIS